MPTRDSAVSEEINLDNTEGGSRGPLQERASYWFYRQMGLQFSMQEYVRRIINGNNQANYEDVQNIEGDYIDMWFPNDADGYIHKIDDYFEYSADGTGFSNIDEGLHYDSSHPLLKETYRWHFEKRGHREDDNWDHFFNFAKAMNTPRAARITSRPSNRSSIPNISPGSWRSVTPSATGIAMGTVGERTTTFTTPRWRTSGTCCPGTSTLR